MRAVGELESERASKYLALAKKIPCSLSHREFGSLEPETIGSSLSPNLISEANAKFPVFSC